jgi:two-component system phosphate regulon sensor histidine kinase PhoR
VLLATLIASGFILSNRARDDAASAIEARLSAEASAVAAATVALGLDRDSVASSARTALSPDTQLLVVMAGGATLYSSGPVSASPIRAPEIVSALEGRASQTVRDNPETGSSELHLSIPLVRDGSIVGAVRVTASRGELGAAARRVVGALATVGGTVALIAWLLVLWTGSPLRRALAHLAEVAQSIARGQLSDRAETAAVAETAALYRAVNDMAEGLERQVRTSYQERDTFGAVLDSMADALLVVDNEGTLALANPAAVAMFQLDPATIYGKRVMEVLRDHEMVRIIDGAFAQRRQQTGQVEFGRDLRLLNVVATPIHERSGISALVLAQDITEVQRLEGVRREFVANVSHELRTPLASIKAAVETLQGGALDDEEVSRDFLERINIEVDHLTQVVQQLLDLSRLETGKAQLHLESINIREVLEEATRRVEPQAKLNRVSLAVEASADLPRALADRANVQETVMDLVDNALKFTQPEGRIDVSARETEEGLEVIVADTGTGILPEDLPHIFERFYKADRSRSSGGTGLGLALAKHMVQAQGGRIWAESTPGQGSRFHFTLPKAPPDGERH